MMQEQQQGATVTGGKTANREHNCKQGHNSNPGTQYQPGGKTSTRGHNINQGAQQQGYNCCGATTTTTREHNSNRGYNSNRGHNSDQGHNINQGAQHQPGGTTSTRVHNSRGTIAVVQQQLEEHRPDCVTATREHDSNRGHNINPGAQHQPGWTTKGAQLL